MDVTLAYGKLENEALRRMLAEMKDTVSRENEELRRMLAEMKDSKNDTLGEMLAEMNGTLRQMSAETNGTLRQMLAEMKTSKSETLGRVHEPLSLQEVQETFFKKLDAVGRSVRSDF